MIKTVLNVDGMACGMCEAHIGDCIRRNLSIKKIIPSHAKGESEIVSEIGLDEKKLNATISEIGYTLFSVSSEDYVKKRLLHQKIIWDKSDAIKYKAS